MGLTRPVPLGGAAGRAREVREDGGCAGVAWRVDDEGGRTTLRRFRNKIPDSLLFLGYQMA